MGFFAEYLNRQMSIKTIHSERKEQLRRISKLRGNRDILVYAADYTKGRLPNSIGYDDILPFSDMLANLKGKALDLIIETPGGSGEVVDEMVQLIRGKYQDLAVIVPGWAKSAGTILAMAADEILMGPTSALGPIDAQFAWQGKSFSAGELIDGMKKIKDEVTKTGNLNRAYIPILQGISPGELQRAENAQEFSKRLVTEWLIQYKFKDWNTHSSTGKSVTDEEKRARARKIASELGDHNNWLTHGKSIKIDDLRKMRLLINDYSEEPALTEAIRRYHILLQMTFQANIFKLIETVDSQVFRHAPAEGVNSGQPILQKQVQKIPSNVKTGIIEIDLDCGKCHTVTKIQANIGAIQPLKPGNKAFPKNNIFLCACGNEINLNEIRQQVETQTKKPIIT